MKVGKTIVLALLVCLCGLAAWILSRRPPSDVIAEHRERVLPDFYASSATAFTLANRHGTFRLEKRAHGGWQILEPRALPADQGEVERLLETLELTRRAPEATAPRAVNTPAASLTLVSEDGKADRWTLRVGTPADPETVPVATAEGTFAAPRSLLERLDATLYDLRIKHLAPELAMEQVKRLDLRREDGSGFTALQNRVWVTEDLRERLSPTALREALRPVWNYRVPPEGILEEADANAEFANRLEFQLPDGGQTWLWSSAPTRFRTLEVPCVYRLPASIHESLDGLRTEALIDTRAARFDPAEVDVIVLGTGEDAFTVRREGALWSLQTDEDRAADRAVVQGFLKDLAGAAVDTSVQVSPAPEGMMRVELRGGNAEGSVTLERIDLAREGDTLLARRPPATAVHPVSGGDYLARAQLAPVGFMDRTILREPVPLAIRLTLERAGARSAAQWSRTQRRWRLAEPVTGETDPKTVRHLLEMFRELRAERIVESSPGGNEATLEEYGLANPAVELSAVFHSDAGGTYKRTLHFGRRAGDSIFATRGNDDRIFTVSHELFESIPTTLASRVVSRTDRLRAYTVESGGRRAGARYVAADRQWVNREGEPLPPEDARRRAVELLADFVARDIAALEPRSATRYGLHQPRLTVRLDEADVRGKSITVGAKHPDGGYYATGPASRYVLIISEDQLRTLQAVLPPAVENGSP
jgi:hypothetical protein